MGVNIRLCNFARRKGAYPARAGSREDHKEDEQPLGDAGPDDREAATANGIDRETDVDNRLSGSPRRVSTRYVRIGTNDPPYTSRSE